MTIQINCQCGQKLSAKPQLAGRRVKCPKCGQAVAVPQPATKQSLHEDLDELLDEAGVASSVGADSCPECHAELDVDAVICVNCGYHREAGKRVKVYRDVAPEEDMSLPQPLRQAMKHIKNEKFEKIAEAGEGYTSWILGLILFAGAAALGAIGIFCFSMGGC